MITKTLYCFALITAAGAAFFAPPVHAGTIPNSQYDKYLGPMRFEFQKKNQCASVVAEIILDYWLGLKKDQLEIGAVLKPHPEAKHVTPDKLIAYFNQYGLRAQAVRSPDYRLIKRLIDAGIPVIVNHRLNSPGRLIGHWTLIRGYSEKNRTFVIADSYFGPNYRVNYAKFADLWRPFGYLFIVAYPAEQEEQIETILGPLTDEKIMIAELEKYVSGELKKAPKNPDNSLNMGLGAYLRGRYLEATKYFEQAQKLGLDTERILWYLEWPVISYNETKNAAKVLELTERVYKSGNTAAGELAYERGRAFLALNKPAEARQEFQKALKVEPNLQAAKKALQQMES